MYPRQLCYEEWKKQHAETSDDAFEGHWGSLSRGTKAVSEALSPYLISSHASLSRSEVRVVGQEGCTLFVQSPGPNCYRLLKLCVCRNRILGRTRPPRASAAFSVFRVWVGGWAGLWPARRSPSVCGWPGCSTVDLSSSVSTCLDENRLYSLSLDSGRSGGHSEIYSNLVRSTAIYGDLRTRST